MKKLNFDVEFVNKSISSWYFCVKQERVNKYFLKGV